MKGAERPAVSEIPGDEFDRLGRLVAAVRLMYQNLVAAGLACLAAEDDGERDPFYYLRDELRAQGQLADDGRWKHVRCVGAKAVRIEIPRRRRFRSDHLHHGQQIPDAALVDAGSAHHSPAREKGSELKARKHTVIVVCELLGVT